MASQSLLFGGEFGAAAFLKCRISPQGSGVFRNANVIRSKRRLAGRPDFAAAVPIVQMHGFQRGAAAKKRKDLMKPSH